MVKLESGGHIEWVMGWDWIPPCNIHISTQLLYWWLHSKFRSPGTEGHRCLFMYKCINVFSYYLSLCGGALFTDGGISAYRRRQLAWGIKGFIQMGDFQHKRILHKKDAALCVPVYDSVPCNVVLDQTITEETWESNGTAGSFSFHGFSVFTSDNVLQVSPMQSCRK